MMDFENINKLTNKQDINRIDDELNTEKVNDYKASYVDYDFVKSISDKKDKYGDRFLKYKFDYDFIMNCDLNEYIKDIKSFHVINDLRYIFADYAHVLNELDRQYLQSIGYDNYKHELLLNHQYEDFDWMDYLSEVKYGKSARLNLSSCFSCFDRLWYALLCTEEQLKMIGIEDNSLEFLKDYLKLLGFELRKKSYKELGIVGEKPRMYKVIYFDNGKKYMIKKELIEELEKEPMHEDYTLDKSKVYDNPILKKEKLLKEIAEKEQQLSTLDEQVRKFQR